MTTPPSTGQPVSKLSELLPPTQPNAPLDADKCLRIEAVLKELTRCKAKYGNIKVRFDYGGSDVLSIDETFATEEGIRRHFNPGLEPFIDLRDR